MCRNFGLYHLGEKKLNESGDLLDFLLTYLKAQINLRCSLISIKSDIKIEWIKAENLQDEHKTYELYKNKHKVETSDVQNCVQSMRISLLQISVFLQSFLQSR